MDERATDKAEAWQKNCMAILGNGEIAVCIKPGPWHGWLFEKHPDGQWVSVEKLQTGPMTPEGHPLATLSAIPAAQGERAGLTEAARDVLAERKRQVEVEGWTAAHDDKHAPGALALAAGCYALYAGGMTEMGRDEDSSFGPDYRWSKPQHFPFDAEWWKPKDTRRDLIRAAALIVAEIERLDRLTATRRPRPKS